MNRLTLYDVTRNVWLTFDARSSTQPPVWPRNISAWRHFRYAANSLDVTEHSAVYITAPPTNMFTFHDSLFVPTNIAIKPTTTCHSQLPIFARYLLSLFWLVQSTTEYNLMGLGPFRSCKSPTAWIIKLPRSSLPWQLCYHSSSFRRVLGTGVYNRPGQSVLFQFAWEFTSLTSTVDSSLISY
jgi:hypothetical protein